MYVWILPKATRGYPKSFQPGALSDSARHEVEHFNPSNASFAQTVRVAQALRQDVANRRQASNDQISDISKRIGAGGTVQDQPAAAQTPAANNATPAIPASISTQYRGMAHYSPSQKKFYYSADGGKTWQTAPP